MSLPRIAAVLSAALLVALPAAPALAQSEAEIKAQLAKLKPRDFPTQPIEITVVYPAGGGMDINGRLVAKYFEKYSGEKAIVNNRTGGAGMIGHTWLATQAPRDGHAVGVIANLIFGDAFVRAQGKWTLDDLDPIAFLNSEGMNFVVSADGPYKDRSMKDMVELAKAKPGTVRITVVPNTSWDVMVSHIERLSGAKFLRVPFQGGLPGITALLGGNVDVGIGFYGEIRGQLEPGKLRHVATSGTGRAPFAPDSPTLNELLGAKDVSYGAIRWVTLPRGVAADRKAWLVAAFQAAVRDPELQAEFRKLGTVPNPAMTTAQLQDMLRKEAAAERETLVSTGQLK
jgi:tripartite-type tricarboxylate transporter receptor subunit TctC